MTEKGGGFTGTIIKDRWTITKGGENRGKRCRGLGWWEGVGKKQKTVLEQQLKTKNKRIFLLVILFYDLA